MMMTIFYYFLSYHSNTFFIYTWLIPSLYNLSFMNISIIYQPNYKNAIYTFNWSLGEDLYILMSNPFM